MAQSIPYQGLELIEKKPDPAIVDGQPRTWSAYHSGLCKGNIWIRKRSKLSFWQTFNMRGALEQFILLSNDKWGCTRRQTTRTGCHIMFEILINQATLSQPITSCIQRHNSEMDNFRIIGVCPQKVCTAHKTHCSRLTIANFDYLSL